MLQCYANFRSDSECLQVSTIPFAAVSAWSQAFVVQGKSENGGGTRLEQDT